MSTPVPESKRLLVLEKIIRQGKRAFIEVGTALAEIRDSELWRIEYNSFKDYCNEQWGWEKAYCNHLIRAACVVTTLPKQQATIVVTESQARELAKVPKVDRAEVVINAAAKAKSEFRPITARDIKAAANLVIDVTADTAPEDQPAPAEPTPEDKQWETFCDASTSAAKALAKRMFDEIYPKWGSEAVMELQAELELLIRSHPTVRLAEKFASLPAPSNDTTAQAST